MRTRHIARTAALAAALLTFAGLAVAAPPRARAATSDVVISELMYNAPAPSLVEFIELYNRGSAAVDLSGWSFAAGITLATPGATFPAGTTLPAGGRIVGTSSEADFQAQYGFAADFSFAGTSLSNGGEEVRLVDAAAADVDAVTYDDASPWPVPPDGFGPSLEVVDPAADNSVAGNWAPSTVNFGTPRAVNTAELDRPLVVSAPQASPARPSPGQSFRVDAQITSGSSATLTYKVMFGTESTVPMLDDAASAGGAGDGTYSATLPGAGAGQLVRYRISATRGSQSGSYPPVGDSRTYDGVVVTDPALANAKFPVLEWFMTDADYSNLLANHRCDGVDAPAVISYNGKVYDGSAMQIRGQSSCMDAKVKWAVALPKGYTIDFGAPFAYPMDEFDIQSEAVPVPRLGWEMIEQAGDPPLRYQTFRTQRNGAFYSVAGILEKYDNIWRAQRGYSDWAIYKVQAGGLRTYSSPQALAASGDVEKKNPDDGDFTDVWNLTQVLSQPDSASKRAWIYANFDIPETVNFTALMVAMRQWDSGSKNFYVVRDIKGTGRWRLLHWDLDGIFNAGKDPKGDFVTPNVSSPLWGSLMVIPEIKAMHFRRVRELSDRFLTGNTLLNRFDQLTSCCASDIALDNQAWGTRTLKGERNTLIAGIQERRDQIAAHTSPAEIPPSQSAAPAVVINEIQYQPAGDGQAEYLELYNPSATESVDLSDWTLDGTGSTYAIPPGTVLLPRAYLVLVRDDNAFRAAYGGNVFVAGQYPGQLPDAGSTLTLRDGSRVVDTVSYSAAPPWPAAAAGTGPSLELVNAAADNTDPANWAASSNAGTPAATNTATGGGGGSTVVLDFGSTWRYLATGPDQGTAWRAAGFDDSAWPSAPGDLGFKNPVRSTIPATAGRVTYYFRSTFSVPSGPAPTAVTLDLVRDDGAVVYLNGVEVARSNMPAGSIGFGTKASLAVNGVAESTPVTIQLPTGSVQTGTNTIAVEVHQKATGSAADLTMDARLTVSR